MITLPEQLSNAKIKVVDVKSKVSEDEHMSGDDENNEPSSEDDSSNSTQRSSPIRLLGGVVETMFSQIKNLAREKLSMMNYSSSRAATW